MTTSRVSRDKLIAAVQALAVAGSLVDLRNVLARYPFLLSVDTDRQLTWAIQAGLERNCMETISIHVVVRGFLECVRTGDMTLALHKIGSLPLHEADPIARLVAQPDSSPHQVALCRRALKLVRPTTEPGLWAYLHFLLADRLMLSGQGQAVGADVQPGLYLLPIEHSKSGEMPTYVRQACAAYESAGDAWEACGECEQAAEARYEHARLLIDFSVGQARITSLTKACNLLDSTSSVWTCQADPKKWGNVQAALGLALKNMPGGLDAAKLERAIDHYEAALPTPAELEIEWARRHYHLATLYNQRYHGDRVANVERAIVLLQDALRIFSSTTYPHDWANAQNALANAFQQRVREDPAQNVEHAIDAYRSALQVWTQDRNPIRWTTIQRNLAEAYRHRILGKADENQEKAIAGFEQALTVYTCHEHPARWASVHNSLANLYCNRQRGDRTHNVEKGIQNYKQALEVYARTAYPRQWAQTSNNLANAYCERIKGEHTENVNVAVDLYRQVLEVRTRKVYPREWAATHNNIGTAYVDLGRWKQAVDHFHKALQVRTVDALPDKTLQTARNLGALHFGRGQWDEAIQAYQTAQAASDALYRQAITEVGKRAEIGRGGKLAHHIAYALAKTRKPREAVLELERARARLLAEALARDRIDLEHADQRDRLAYDNTLSRIRALESELRAAELDAQGATDAPTKARSFLEIANDLETANREMKRIVDAIGQGTAGTGASASLRFCDVVSAVQADRPLVYLVATPAGGLASIVHSGGIAQVWLGDLTDKALSERVQKWFDVYFAYAEAYRKYAQARRELDSGKASEEEKKRILGPLFLVVESTRQAWFAVLDDTTHWLWQVLMERLVLRLQKLACRCATLVPTGLLSFLPLHAAWQDGEKGSSRRYALDGVAFAYVPSARALLHARQIAGTTRGETLFAVNNPDGSLRYADQEVSAILQHFSKPWVVSGERATRNTALDAFSQCDVYHFASHGNNNWLNTLGSTLWMYGQVPLTVADLLGVEGSLQAHLVFLSACESGLVGTALPDEVIGLAAGFVQAGAATVVSSLWSVDDESTAFLAERFYENWKGKGMPPLEALAAAQKSVRDRTNGRCWEHPYYWAAFTLTGGEARSSARS